MRVHIFCGVMEETSGARTNVQSCFADRGEEEIP